MGVSLFSAPVSGTADDLPVLILGIESGVDQNGTTSSWFSNALCVNDEGRLKFVRMTQIQLDWRYDWRTHSWIDTGDMNGDTQDPSTDGSPGVPGLLSQSDRVGPSDPFDPEGREAPGDLGGLDTREEGPGEDR